MLVGAHSWWHTACGQFLIHPAQSKHSGLLLSQSWQCVLASVAPARMSRHAGVAVPAQAVNPLIRAMMSA